MKKEIVLLVSLFFSIQLFNFSVLAQNPDIPEMPDIPASATSRQYCPGCATQSEQGIYIPLIDLPESKGSQIVFNSRSAHPVDVTPVFYTLDGAIITGAPVTINSTEIRYVDLKTLIPAEHRDRQDWGGLSLKYYGGNREMWAQFRFLKINGGNNVDEFFVVESEQRSDLKAATWWTPTGSTSVIALGNVTGNPTSASVRIGSQKPQIINLAPHATSIIRHQQSGRITSESVLITVAGPAGSVVPTGLIEAANKNSNSVIRFYDPRFTRQPKLYANGLALKNVTPHMILNNTAPYPIIATPKFIPTEGLAANPVSLPQVNLEPNQSIEVNLSELMEATAGRKDLDVVSVEVDSNAERGDLIGALYTREKGTGFTYDIPLRDSGPVRSMTGSYPWKVDEDFSTIVYITNITDIPQEFAGQINFEGGSLSVKPRRLAPGETAEIDIRKLRDEQKTDDLGRKIPANAKLGQFRWAVHGVTGGKLALIGRAVMQSKSNRIMTSYSCNDPCPPYWGGWIAPVYLRFAVGESGTMEAWEIGYYNDGWNQTILGPYQVGAQWSMDCGTYCTMNTSNGDGEFTGIAPGTTYVTALIGTYESYTWDGLNCYDNGFTYDVTDNGPVETTPVVTNVTANGATKISQITGNTNFFHFVTPKGAANSMVILTATISPDTEDIRAGITWEGATQSGKNPLVATVPKSSASKNVVKIKYNGNVIKELRVWVVWSTITSPSDFPIESSSNGQFGIPPGTGLVTRGGYRFNHTIAPTTIVTDTDRPDFSGTNTTAPPGGNHPIFVNDPLSGGANKKWDVSRQIRLKVISSATISSNDFTQPAFPNIPNYPSNDVEGNDNRNVVNENNTPTSSGVLTDADRPEYGIVDRAAANGDTYEARMQFKEFTRLEIEGVWTRISDDFLWRIHFKFLKVNGLWTDNGTSKALDNSGF